MTDTETRPLRAADKIDAELRGRIEQLQELGVRMHQANEADDIDLAEEVNEELNCFPLDVRIRSRLFVQISTGGPGDEFEIEIEKGEYGWELADTHATYRYIEWFDPAEIRTDDPVVIEYLNGLLDVLDCS